MPQQKQCELEGLGAKLAKNVFLIHKPENEFWKKSSIQKLQFFQKPIIVLRYVHLLLQKRQKWLFFRYWICFTAINFCETGMTVKGSSSHRVAEIFPIVYPETLNLFYYFSAVCE